MKVVIFEDEVHNSERLLQLLKKCDPAVEVVAIIDSVAEGIKWMEQQNKADLMLMDIQLSDGNCFEIFKQANSKTPIIFTTAYDNFALQAFKVNSIDYLMKPIDGKELKNALDKYRQFKPVEQPVIDIASIAREFFKRESTRFIGRLNNQLIYVKAKDIAYLQFSKGVTYAITANNQKMPLDYSLDEIDKLLDRHLFFRINRQFIVHIDAIRKILTYYNSRLIIQLHPDAGADVIISRDRVADFRNWLEGKQTAS